MKTRWIAASAALSTLLLASSAWGLNIVLTNDDGFETENIRALFDKLEDAGHEVVMSAPYVNQSGTSAQLPFLRPIAPTSTDSEQGSIPAGAPGVGEVAPNQHYVDGPPALAVLYGIDVLAQKRWGTFPDLVISGPNEGNNLGVVTPHSGTVGATVTAINKGIPAIAVSAAGGDAEDAELVADLTVKLVDSLEARIRQFPAGVGLNVNIPEVDGASQTAEDFGFEFTRIGTSANFGLRFYERLGDSPIAVAYGIPSGLALPGLSLEMPASAAGYPEDENARSETNALQAGNRVTISVIQGTYQASIINELRARRTFYRLLGH
jgi:5'-nucleotidase